MGGQFSRPFYLSMIRKRCPRCGALIEVGSVCPCMAAAQAERHKEYKKYRADKDEQAFYTSARWRGTRAYVLARDAHLCRVCLKRGKLTPARTVHHIDELKEGGARHDPENLVSLCESCHQTIHARYLSDERDAVKSKLKALTQIPPGV